MNRYTFAGTTYDSKAEAITAAAELFPDGASLVALSADDENNAEAWWSALDGEPHGLDLDALRRDEGVVADAATLERLRGLPGWEGGPDYAPHPLLVEEISAEDVVDAVIAAQVGGLFTPELDTLDRAEAEVAEAEERMAAWERLAGLPRGYMQYLLAGRSRLLGGLGWSVPGVGLWRDRERAGAIGQRWEALFQRLTS